MGRETKSFQCEIKALGTAKNDAGQEFGQIECYPAVFNVVDQGNDRILPQAFNRTIRSAKDRAISRKTRYLLPMLWNHSPEEVIGGWHTVDADDFGLKCAGDINLGTQRGREYYELARAGMAGSFSIIYETLPGGAKYDKSGVRELSELRLHSCDPVTFPMCEDTELISVKNIESKSATVCGNTSGKIGARDEAWDGSKAEKQIWAAAYDDDTGDIDTALAKKYFMLLDGDAQQKGSYKLPFWYVGDDPHISVGAVKAIAGAVMGSRGAGEFPDGVKAKVATLYSRINKRYPNDPELTPPWQDDASDSKKDSRPMEKKTFAEHLAESHCQDLLEDWSDILLSAFTSSVFDAMKIGDTPESDVHDALTAFGEAVMQWVSQAQECNLSQYLSDQSYDMGTESTMQNGSSSYYGYMSRHTPMQSKASQRQAKAMTADDATTGGFTEEHVTALKNAAKRIQKKADDHAAALHDAADSITSMVSGTKALLHAKEGRALSSANVSALQQHADGLDAMADTLTKSVTRQVKAVNTVADDLATILQGSESAYGTDPGTPEQGHQEGKSSTPPQARASNEPSSRADTVSEDEIAAALAQLQSLRNPA